jgi:acyl transferase domain-containing protein
MSNAVAPLDAQHPTLLLLSAQGADALDRRTQRLADWITDTCRAASTAPPLPQVAATLRELPVRGRHRRVVRVDSWTDAQRALTDRNRQVTTVAVEGEPKVIMALPGQGTLRPGVLARLLAQQPAWAAELARLSELANALSGFDCAAWLSDAKADPDRVLKDNGKTQLAIFCVGVSLARWLAGLGVHPDGYVGHSLGEWMGATLAGVLSDEDAIRAVYHRGRLMQSTGPGAAIIVRQTPDALASKLPTDVALACVNAPNLCLVSGRPDAVARCAETLGAERIVTRPAPIHVAVHSPIMDDVVEPFRAELAALRFRVPRTPMLSTVTGQWMSPDQAGDVGYWARQLRAPVRYDWAAETLLAEPCFVLLEVGIGSALTSLTSTRIKDRDHHRALALFGREEPPAEGYDPTRPMLALGELWANGVNIDPIGAIEITGRTPDLSALDV